MLSQIVYGKINNQLIQSYYSNYFVDTLEIIDIFNALLHVQLGNHSAKLWKDSLF